MTNEFIVEFAELLDGLTTSADTQAAGIRD